MPTATRSLVGPIPDPDELFGRAELINGLWRQIPSANILLLAPRRFGKSGVMHHVRQKPRLGFHPIYIDVEEFTTPAQFADRLIDKVLKDEKLKTILRKAKAGPSTVVNWFGRTLEKIEVAGHGIGFRLPANADWREVATHLLQTLEKADHPIIFILDELPTMLARICSGPDGVQEMTDFLRWFRSVRMDLNDDLRRHRFLVAGSNGVDVFLNRQGLAAEVNDFTRIFVEEITEGSANDLINSLCETLKIDLGDLTANDIIETIECRVPYFIHMLLQQVQLLPPMERQPLNRDTLQATYRSRVIGVACKSYFNHYRARLDRYDSARKRCVYALLGAAADHPGGAIPDERLFQAFTTAARNAEGFDEIVYRELLADLECDWYLTRSQDGITYSFRVGVMRDWWKRWFGPVQRRSLAMSS